MMRNEKSTIGKSGNFFSIFIPVATVFISSFCVMALEMAAGRLIARYLGFSLYTWTAVIGVVLAGITIGYYIGGRIADKFNAQQALAVLFIAGSVACVLTVISGNIVSEWLFLWSFGWAARVFSHMTLMFLLPCILLGAITPVAAKMALEKGLSKGRTVGDIYAWGAAGSIAGTLAAGFYLIPALGTIPLIWTVAGVLALLAIMCRLRFQAAYLWLAVFVLMLIIATAPAEWCQSAGGGLLLRERIDPRVIYQDESRYCYIAVKQLSVFPDRRIFMQDTLRHSDIIMGDINDLQYEYEIIYSGVTRLLSKNKDKLNVMFIGGGGYVFPRYIESNWPGSRIDVIEIDPAVTKAAVAAFGLDPNSSINTLFMDARNYVDGLLEKQRNGGQTYQYDFIYEDAFNDYSVPYQLVTREFNDKIARILADDGVYVLNLIDTYNSALFLGAVVNTLQETFPHVYVTAEQAFNSSVRQTFVVAAAKKPFDIKAVEGKIKLKLWHPNEAEMEHFRNRSSGIVLTDNYAPVENLLAPVVRQSSREMLARRYLDDAKSLKAEGKWYRSIKAFENAVWLNPTISILAYNEIGLMQAEHNNPQEAARAFQSAIDYYNRVGNRERVIGSVYLNLGILLQQMGQNEEAGKQLNRAVEEFHLELTDDPNSASVWSRLGETLGTLGDLKAAADAFEKAAELEPENLAHRYSLAQALEFQGRLTDAIDVVKKALELASRYNQQDVTAEFNKYLKSLELKKSQAAPPNG
ncbi:MAG: fused MFS/spermidine synthase [Planctomycetota bacterium]